MILNSHFGTKGKVTSKKILEKFDLAYQWKKNKENIFIKGSKLQNGQVPDILFIERCLHFIKENGRLAIVLPDGDLTNSSLEYVRNYIDENARIIAIVSLPNETFTHTGAGVKASVLFLQKISKKELDSIKLKNYKIFTAVIEKIGYDIRGRTVYKKDNNGNILKKEIEIVNHDGTIQKQSIPIIDTDIPEITEEFEKFKINESIDW